MQIIEQRTPCKGGYYRGKRHLYIGNRYYSYWEAACGVIVNAGFVLVEGTEDQVDCKNCVRLIKKYGTAEAIIEEKRRREEEKEEKEKNFWGGRAWY